MRLLRVEREASWKVTLRSGVSSNASRMLITDFLTADRGGPNDERRTMCAAMVSSNGGHRAVFVAVSCGMMDLGLAHKAMPLVREPCQRFADDEAIAPVGLLRELRRTITELERETKRFCGIQLVTFEIRPGIATISRVGGHRIWLCDPSGARVIGREDAWPFEPHELFAKPEISTAALRPDVRWCVDRGPGWTLAEEKDEADRSAATFRVERLETRDADVSFVVVSHPFWTKLDEPAQGRSHAEITRHVKAVVEADDAWSSAALVVLARPV